jgi:hypothetical protein
MNEKRNKCTYVKFAGDRDEQFGTCRDGVSSPMRLEIFAGKVYGSEHDGDVIQLCRRLFFVCCD